MTINLHSSSYKGGRLVRGVGQRAEKGRGVSHFT